MHFLRDVHTLKKEFPHDQARLTWAKAIKAIYDDAVVWAAQEPDQRRTPREQQQARVAQQRAFEQQLWTLCQPYMQTEAPQQTLCTRVERFLPELFVFVTVPGFLRTTIWRNAAYARL